MAFLESVEFQMSLLLFVSLLGYLVGTRLGKSVVVGEILVGIIMGPSLLGLVTYTDFVKELAALGSIFLLFVIGLHCRLKELYTLKSLAVACVGVIVPWLGGFGLAWAFGYNTISSVFVGTALTATSIAITVHVLKEMGRMNTDAAKTIVGAAVIDDVIGLIALSFTEQIAAGNLSVGYGFQVLGAALAFLVLGTIVGVYFLVVQLERLDKWAAKHGVPQTTFIAAVCIAFFYSAVAESVGLSAIVGAFVAGACLERLPIKIYRTGSEYLEIIFASIFFVSLGVLINIQEISGIGFFLAALCVVAIGTKLVGCYAPAKWLGMSSRDAWTIGLGMVPRGEIAMITALYGLRTGVVGQEIYSSILLMALVTTIATPFMMKNMIEKGRLL